MPSSAKEATGAESEEEFQLKDSNCVSSKPENDKQPPMMWSDISSTTNDVQSSTSDTESTVGPRRPTHRSVLPTFATATAAAAPPVQPREKKPRRAGFREQFLQQVRGKRSIKTSTTRACLNRPNSNTRFFVSTPPYVITAQSNAGQRKPEE